MFGKKKKVSTVANKNELAELDTSVSELSKQTSELLKDFGIKESSAEGTQDTKDTATKSKAHTKTAATRSTVKSFDIIQNPKTRTSLRSTLKSAPPQATQPEEEPALLPEHATESYNETVSSEAKEPIQDVSPVLDSNSDTPVITGHRAGSLKLSSEVSDADKDVNQMQEADDKVSESEVADSSITTADTVDSKQGITFDEDSPADEDNSGEVASEETDSTSDQDDEAMPKEQAAVPATEQENQESTEAVGASNKKTDEAEPSAVTDEVTSTAQDTGELFANNLVHDSKPKSYTPLESQQKPTVFDTNEYHVELHDWSKLEHKSGSSWIILIVLLLLAGALAYVILSGQSLPFIGNIL